MKVGLGVSVAVADGVALGVVDGVALGLGVSVGVSVARRAMPSSGTSPLTRLSAPKMPSRIKIKTAPSASGARRLAAGRLIVGCSAAL